MALPVGSNATVSQAFSTDVTIKLAKGDVDTVKTMPGLFTTSTADAFISVVCRPSTSSFRPTWRSCGPIGSPSARSTRRLSGTTASSVTIWKRPSRVR